MPSHEPLCAQHLSGCVYYLPADGGNVAVCAGKEGAMIVDIPQAHEVHRIMAAIKQLHPGDFNFLVNTHAHGDHTAGNALLNEQMPIIAHNNVREWMQKERHIRVGIQTTIPAQPIEALPRLVFEDLLTLHLNQEEIHLIHYPHGHTDSDIIVWFTKANVAHLGDLFWPEIFPFVDAENGGSVDGLIKNIKELIYRLPENTQLIPGHGPPDTMQGLQDYLEMLTETCEFIRTQHKSGKSKAEILAGFPRKWLHKSCDFLSTSGWVDIVLFNP